MFDAAIIGAGPAGLTSAFALTREKASVVVLEADPRYVGGISRTEEHHGFLFDIGGHRFFSKSEEIEKLWSEILPDGFILRPRKSRIFFDGKLYPYPLQVGKTLQNLGLAEAARCLLSYLKVAASPIRNPQSFEDWTTNQFGERLYLKFFKTYTEKVWGMDCSEISADWAAQRIQKLSMARVIGETLFPGLTRDTPKTLTQSFRYPRTGPGHFWRECAQRIRQQGGKVQLDARVESCVYQSETSEWEITCRSSHGNTSTYRARNLISSAPLRELCHFLAPQVSPETRAAAEKLRYRDFLIVVLMIEGEPTFDDQWIYIHDPEVRVGRIQNFKSWSPEMVPREGVASYGLEYFCFENDPTWKLSDSELIENAKVEFTRLALAPAPKFVDACVVRQRKAYPVYDDHYSENVSKIRRELEEKFPSLHLVGRNGMHKYNNQDHSMMTALIAAKNILAGHRIFDPWKVNSDAIYQEEGDASPDSGSSLRQVPRGIR